MIATLALVAALSAQDAVAIERRLAAAPDGEVRFAFAARPGVVGDGRGIIAWDCTDWGRCRQQHMEGDFDNEPGPVRVSLRVRDGL